MVILIPYNPIHVQDGHLRAQTPVGRATEERFDQARLAK